jgi:hypothetical protein
MVRKYDYSRGKWKFTLRKLEFLKKIRGRAANLKEINIILGLYGA